MPEQNEKPVESAIAHVEGALHSKCPACRMIGAESSLSWKQVRSQSEPKSYSKDRRFVLVIGTLILLSYLLFGVAVGVSLRWMLYGLVALFFSK